VDGDYELTGLAVPESLDLLHDLLETVRREHPEVDGTDLMLFETAIVEIHGNVVRHGRPPGGISYSFALSVRPDRLSGTLSAAGDPVPDGVRVTAPDDPMAEDGRGVWLADTILDTLDYSRQGEVNTWRMTKELSRA
jgi:serine/threonine-protein kinase RsbW